MHQSNYCKQHSLVSSGQILQKLFGFFSLQLDVIGEHRRKVVVGILTALPVCRICFNTQHLVFNFPYRLIGGDGNNVNAEHEISRYISKLCDNVIADICSIILKKHHTSIFFTEHEIVIIYFNAVRGNIVFEAVTPLRKVRQIEIIR